MTTTSARLSLEGMLDLIPKSRRPLAPLFEAISNGLEAIVERRNRTGWNERGLISLKFYFSGLIPEARRLERLEIIDNGIGFDDENFARFETFLDRTKGFNNRGSGRVQFLHIAHRIEVKSHFETNRTVMLRHFVCNPVSFITNPTLVPASTNAIIGTTITLSDFGLTKESEEFFASLTLEELRNAIKSHFLLRLHLARTESPTTAPEIYIEYFKNQESEGHVVLKPIDVPQPEVGEIKVPYVKVRDVQADQIEWLIQPSHVETLHWAHFKLPASELPENGVMLCSKGITVDRVRFENLKKSEAVDGHRFLTAVHGEALSRGENVNHTVDRFTLPTRADTEKSIRDGGHLFLDPSADILFIDDIEQAIESALPAIYADLYARKEDQRADIEAIAKAHGIPPDVVRATKIGLTDTEDQITEKLFRKQAEGLAAQSLKIKRLFESLDKLDPTDDNYQSTLEERSNELLQLIPEQNKEELSRYIIRRQMVAKVLGLILDEKLVVSTKSKKTAKGKAVRQDKEGLIHDLLIRRKTKTTTGPNDLWVLSEEFVHFEGCSELPLDQITDQLGNKFLRPITEADLESYGIKGKRRRRPDIFLFVDEQQCILIELKAPDVDLSEHLLQLERYCNLIANFSVAPINRFHCYLIGENASDMDLAGRYRQNIHGDWVNRTSYKVMRYQSGRQEEEIGEAHIEIIKLSSIAKRALRRNKSFAERLGIADNQLQPKSSPHE